MLPFVVRVYNIRLSLNVMVFRYYCVYCYRCCCSCYCCCCCCLLLVKWPRLLSGETHTPLLGAVIQAIVYIYIYSIYINIYIEIVYILGQSPSVLFPRHTQCGTIETEAFTSSATSIATSITTGREPEDEGQFL